MEKFLQDVEFGTSGDLVSFVNHNKIQKQDIVDIVFWPNPDDRPPFYVLFFFAIELLQVPNDPFFFGTES